MPRPLHSPLPAPRPFLAPLLRAGVLAATALLAGCPGGGDQGARQLESITVTDADGTVVSVSRFDYAAGDLVRVRAYNQPGDDGIIGTGDDPLVRASLGDLDRLLAPGEGYTRCEVVREPNRQLHAPYAEQLGDGRLQRLFAPHTDCVLPGQSATRVTSTYVTSPGADGLWFTADDTASDQRILERTVGGSELRQVVLTPPDLPENTAYNLNGTGLNNIVYDPLAGLPLTSTLAIHYGYDNRGRVASLQSDRETQNFSYADDGSLAVAELILPAPSDPDANIILALYPPLTRFREEYRHLDAQRTAVESYGLMDKAVYDSMVASPTGQILLTVLGLSAAGEISLDGLAWVKLGMARYLMDRSDAMAEKVTRLAQPGPDGEWFTADDVVAATATLRYAPAPGAQEGSRGTRNPSTF